MLCCSERVSFGCCEFLLSFWLCFFVAPIVRWTEKFRFTPTFVVVEIVLVCRRDRLIRCSAHAPRLKSPPNRGGGEDHPQWVKLQHALVAVANSTSDNTGSGGSGRAGFSLPKDLLSLITGYAVSFVFPHVDTISDKPEGVMWAGVNPLTSMAYVIMACRGANDSVKLRQICVDEGLVGKWTKNNQFVLPFHAKKNVRAISQYPNDPDRLLIAALCIVYEYDVKSGKLYRVAGGGNDLRSWGVGDATGTGNDALFNGITGMVAAIDQTGRAPNHSPLMLYLSMNIGHRICSVDITKRVVGTDDGADVVVKTLIGSNTQSPKPPQFERPCALVLDKSRHSLTAEGQPSGLYAVAGAGMWRYDFKTGTYRTLLESTFERWCLIVVM